MKRGVVIEDDGMIDLPATGAGVVLEGEGDEAVAKQASLPERAIRNDDGTVTLRLIRPVTLTIRTSSGQSDEVYDTLTFREMTGLNLRMIAQAPPAKQTVVALSQATGIKQHRMEPLFDLMLARDVTAAAAVIGFLQE